MEPRLSAGNYKHTFRYRIRSHECDRQGVVHNARYLEILEVARIEYCRGVLQIPMDAGTFSHHHKFVFVRNAMDYFSPAVFDEELIVYTKVEKLGRTSVTLSQIIDSTNGGRRILEAEAVMVSLNAETNDPQELDETLRWRAARWEQI